MSNQINESKITYRKVGDYHIPNLTLPAEERSIALGKWGLMHKDYLKNHRRVQFNIMLTKGTLYQHCAEVEQQAQEIFFLLIDNMAKAEGITEQLKADNQMVWGCKMNNIQARAREIVNSEIIYN